MAKSKNENINVTMFQALKVSEESRVPVLFMSNPGIGKSTTVELFAEVRGYHLQLLRGNSTTESEVLGYDVADTSEGSKTTKHMRPSWYTKILEKSSEGIPTLLFLDEITTANDWVQGALLHLIFERKVGDEDLPEDTLIVSAGNYSQNLSNNMNMLPPLMNRFMIINLIPESSDLDIFLNKYRGAIASPEGKIVDKKEELLKLMRQLDSQEDSTFSGGALNKVGEHIERCIYEVTRLLWEKEKLIDLSEKDLKDIYSDTEDEKKLYGFVTFRTLNYLRDITIAMFRCFGKAGLVSDNYRNMIDGLCGIGIVKDGKGNTKISRISKNYFDAMRATANEIEKMKNSSLPQYERFFFDMIDTMKKRDSKKLLFEKAEMQAIINKMTEFSKDSSVSSIERPIDLSIIGNICSALVDSGASISKVTVPKSSTDSNPVVDPTMLAGKIEYWNLMMDIYGTFSSLITNTKNNYDSATIEKISDIQKDLRKYAFCLKSLRKMLLTKDPTVEKLLPTMKDGSLL